MKKVLSIAIITVIILAFTTTIFAAPGSFFGSADMKSTDQFLVKITRPEGDESTFKKSYVVCGNSDKEDIIVQFLIFNQDKGVYEPFENTDGECEWTIGGSGFFTKEVVLPEIGANNIRITAFKGSDRDNLAGGAEYQLNDFAITVLSENMKEQIKDGLVVTEILKQFNINLFGN